MRQKPRSTCEYAIAGSAHQRRICEPPRGALQMAIAADREIRERAWAEARHVKTVERLQREAQEAQREWDRQHRFFRVRVSGWAEKGPGAKHALHLNRPLPLRVGRNLLPRYLVPMRDRQGRLFVFHRIRYYSAKTTKQGRGAEAARYQMDGAYQLDDGSQCIASNIGESYDEIVAAFDQAELVNRTAAGCSKTLFHGIFQSCHDLTPEEQFAMAKSYAEYAFGRQGLPYLVVLHPPSEEGDQRNWHVHLLYSLRPMRRIDEGEWEFGKYLRTDLDAPEQFKHLRMLWAEEMNIACEEAGIEKRYTHLSYAAAGCDFIPQKHLGTALSAKVRRGEDVARNTANHKIAIRNALRLAKLEGQRAIAAAIERVRVLAEQAFTLAKEVGVTTAEASTFTSIRGVNFPEVNDASSFHTADNDDVVDVHPHRSPLETAARLPPLFPTTTATPHRSLALQSGTGSLPVLPSLPEPGGRSTTLAAPVPSLPPQLPHAPVDVSELLAEAVTSLPPALDTMPQPEVALPEALLGRACDLPPDLRCDFTPAEPKSLRTSVMPTLPAAPPSIPLPEGPREAPLSQSSALPLRLLDIPCDHQVNARAPIGPPRLPPDFRSGSNSLADPKDTQGMAPMEVAKGLGRLREKLQEAHALHDRKERGEGTSVGSDQNFSVPSAPVARQTHADASAINQQPPSEPKDGRNGGGSDPQQAGTKSSHQQPVQAKRPGPEEKPCSVYEKTRSTISTVILPPERADDGEALARATDYGQSDGARFDLMIVAPTGEVTPDPRVWKKNGLERSAIYHASVQASLKAIAVEQQRYFDHLQSLLYIHVDSATRRAGDKAILYALPEDERKAAERWTGGSKWKDLLQQLKAYQERQERELSKRRERFQQLNRQLPMEPDQS